MNLESASTAARLAGWVTALILAAAAAGCAGGPGPHPIPLGASCATCGMEIQDLHFACERVAGAEARFYDSIECLLKDTNARRDAAAYLPDYDRKTLHGADSLWIVKGRFPTPMDGGLAAFSSRPAADQIASQTQGLVLSWGEVLKPASETP